MKVEIDTESDEFRKVIEQSVMESDMVQNQISNILETDEMQELLTARIKEIIISNEIDEKLKEKVEEYIEDDFSIEDDGEIKETITNSVRDFIMSKFSK